MVDRYAQEMAARDAAQRKEALEREEAERRRVAAVRDAGFGPSEIPGRLLPVRPISDQFVTSASDPAVIPNVPEGPWEVLGRDATALRNEGFDLSVPKPSVPDIESVIHKAEDMATVAEDEGADRAAHRKSSREGKSGTKSVATVSSGDGKNATTVQSAANVRLTAPNATTETKGAKDAARPNTPNTPQTPSQPKKDNQPKG